MTRVGSAVDWGCARCVYPSPRTLTTRVLLVLGAPALRLFWMLSLPEEDQPYTLKSHKKLWAFLDGCNANDWEPASDAYLAADLGAAISLLLEFLPPLAIYRLEACSKEYSPASWQQHLKTVVPALPASTVLKCELSAEHRRSRVGHQLSSMSHMRWGLAATCSGRIWEDDPPQTCCLLQGSCDPVWEGQRCFHSEHDPTEHLPPCSASSARLPEPDALHQSCTVTSPVRE